MNWYNVFYWLTVSSGVKSFFDVTSNIFTSAAIASFIIFVILIIVKSINISDNKLKTSNDDNTDPDFRGVSLAEKYVKHIFYISLGLSLFTWMGYVVTPTKKDCLLIITGGSIGNFVTSDSSAKQIPADAMKFLHLSLQKEIKELDKETQEIIMNQVPSKKNDFVDKIKTLSKDELIKFVQSDSTFFSK